MRIPSLLPIASALAVLLTVPARGQDSVEDAIRARIAEAEAAWAAGDADATAAIYTVDGVHVFANGATYRGREAIADGLREMFAGPMTGTRMKITPERIRLLSPDVALEEASFSLAGMKSPDGTEVPPLNGLCLAVYRNDAGQWMAAAVQCMVPLRPPPAG